MECEYDVTNLRNRQDSMPLCNRPWFEYGLELTIFLFDYLRFLLVLQVLVGALNIFYIERSDLYLFCVST